MFACWFQPELISHGTVFFSHNKSAAAGLISPKTNQQTCCISQLDLDAWLNQLGNRERLYSALYRITYMQRTHIVFAVGIPYKLQGTWPIVSFSSQSTLSIYYFSSIMFSSTLG